MIRLICGYVLFVISLCAAGKGRITNVDNSYILGVVMHDLEDADLPQCRLEEHLAVAATYGNQNVLRAVMAHQNFSRESDYRTAMTAVGMQCQEEALRLLVEELPSVRTDPNWYTLRQSMKKCSEEFQVTALELLDRFE